LKAERCNEVNASAEPRDIYKTSSLGTSGWWCKPATPKEQGTV